MATKAKKKGLHRHYPLPILHVCLNRIHIHCFIQSWYYRYSSDGKLTPFTDSSDDNITLIVLAGTKSSLEHH